MKLPEQAVSKVEDSGVNLALAQPAEGVRLRVKFCEGNLVVGDSQGKRPLLEHAFIRIRMWEVARKETQQQRLPSSLELPVGVTLED